MDDAYNEIFKAAAQGFFSEPFIWAAIAFCVIAGIAKINHDLNKEKKRKAAKEANMRKMARYIKEEFDKDK